ncbi:MAG: hypothetical protein PHQ40_14690 [Anaerolineaceae bacterium]|nr:hypothetical protein [Anaerolineaceae bacterium]
MGKIELDDYLSKDFDAARGERIDRKKRRLTQREKRMRVQSERIEIGEKIPADLQPDFRPSFAPGRQERTWLLGYLEEFYNNQIITDVLGRARGGKEATVYCCAAHPNTGLGLIAAKVYRPAMFRSLRNDAVYRQGREVVDRSGKAVRSRRETLAVLKNTRYGQELRHASWLEAEFETMQVLYDAGANVPRPLSHNSDVILMEYVGTEKTPAPTLNQMHLERSEALALFEELVRNLEIMLSCQRVHADLSAYNVLYWEGQFMIIDFPQAVDPRRNPEARTLFARDVERLCQYFTRYRVICDAASLASDLWSRFQAPGGAGGLNEEDMPDPSI